MLGGRLFLIEVIVLHLTVNLGKASLRSFAYIVSFMNRNSSSGRAFIRSMTQMSSIGTVPVALGSKMAQNLRR